MLDKFFESRQCDVLDSVAGFAQGVEVNRQALQRVEDRAFLGVMHYVALRALVRDDLPPVLERLVSAGLAAILLNVAIVLGGLGGAGLMKARPLVLIQDGPI